MKFSSDEADVAISAPYGTVFVGGDSFRTIDEALQNIDRLRESTVKLHEFVMKADAGYAQEVTRLRMNKAHEIWRRRADAKFPDSPEKIAEALAALKDAQAAYVAAGGKIHE